MLMTLIESAVTWILKIKALSDGPFMLFLKLNNELMNFFTLASGASICSDRSYPTAIVHYGDLIYQTGSHLVQSHSNASIALT